MLWAEAYVEQRVPHVNVPKLHQYSPIRDED